MKSIIKTVYAATILCSLFITMNSCSVNDEQVYEPVSEVKLVNHRLTAEQATQNALDFVNQFVSSTRAEHKNLSVAEVKAFSIEKNLTRMVDSIPNLDSLFYVVNFADNKGFVLAASDDRETPVFAYVEDGSFEEVDTTNNGYEAFVDALIDMESTRRAKGVSLIQPDDQSELIDAGGGSSNYKPDMFEVMYPLLKTKWDQETYNQYCPGPYTGCVVTAIAQICSFLKAPNHISWAYNGVGNECYIDWDNILSECSFNNGNTDNPILIDQIANLMRFWGIAFDAEYKDGGTSVNSEDAISKMRSMGYNATKLSDYNDTNVMNDLKRGDRIVFMRGNGRYYHVGFVFRKYVDGHGWVVDGYIFSRKNQKENIYLHCNWGWGGSCNGYFLSNVLNAEELPYYDDNANPITRSANFRYKLKTSTICK